MLTEINIDKLKSATSEMTVRFWMPEDMPFLKQAIEALGPDSLGRYYQGWADTYESEASLKWVAVIDEKAVGFAALSTHGEPQVHVTFHTGMVHPDYQRRGIGTVLFLTRLLWLQAELNELRMFTTEAALPFYQRFGFSIIEELKYNTVYSGSICTLSMPITDELPRRADQILRQLPQVKFAYTSVQKVTAPKPEINRSSYTALLVIISIIMFLSGFIISTQINKTLEKRSAYNKAERVQRTLDYAVLQNQLESYLEHLQYAYPMPKSGNGDQIIIINEYYQLRIHKGKQIPLIEQNTGIYPDAVRRLMDLTNQPPSSVQ